MAFRKQQLRAEIQEYNMHLLKEGKRKCMECKIIQDVAVFRNIAIKGATEPINSCRTCNDKTVLSKRERPVVKQMLQLLKTKMSSGCSQIGGCDDKREDVVLHLDHIDPTLKINEVCEGMLNWWTAKYEDDEVLIKYQAELDKCQVLCVKHHRMKTMTETRLNVKEKVLRKRDVVRAFKWQKGECHSCGLLVTADNIDFAFDCNHIDPNSKSECIPFFVRASHSVARLEIELQKCNLLCVNVCHPRETRRQMLERRYLKDLL
jgi:hypothetical protein